jgi:4-hydroxy-3-methylbut-2-enyl diphosphate reductase
VKELSSKVDLLLVVGSVNSSNSNRLRELAEKRGVPAYLIDGAEDIRDEWLAGAASIGVTAGASAPESLVQGVIEQLKARGGRQVEELSGIHESMEFALPRELRVKLVD